MCIHSDPAALHAHVFGFLDIHVHVHVHVLHLLVSLIGKKQYYTLLIEHIVQYSTIHFL